MRPWAVLAWALCGGGSVEAQEAPPPVTLPDTEVRFLSSQEGIGYKLYVSLPPGYEASDEAYPVVYLLDADYSFAIARNIVEHLGDRGHLRRVIVVGIAYGGPPAYRMNRTRDYTPTHSPTGGYGPEYQTVSGGGPRFRRFIGDDLIPFVGRTYRTTSERYLVGHSYGGLFATWMALTAPSLFSGFVIVSPSLWYDSGMIFDVERATAEARAELPLRVYMSVGSREINSQHDMVADLRRMGGILDGRGYRGLDLRWEVAPDETHNSIFPRALSNGLRYVLNGT
ncbi:MAG TPA: alpha/beta fold hydrolase [Longimicrobiales bacterium]|nr:alpha/beta fold hydrolase [Longimicrobiales bacterium]